MDTRLLLVLAAVALLQSLLGRKKRAASQPADQPEGIAGPPGEDMPLGEGGLGERGEAGGWAGDTGRAGDASGEGRREGWSLPAEGPSPGRTTAAQEPIATGPRSRTVNPGPVRRKPPVAAEAPKKGLGLLAELFAELEAQAKKEMPFPFPGGGGPEPPSRPTSAETASPARPSSELPSFGLGELQPSDAGYAGRAPRQAGDVPGAVRPKAPAPVADLSPPRERRWSMPSVMDEEALEQTPRRRPRLAAHSDPLGLATNEGLRRVIVAREVLGPPLALRKEDQEASWQ